MRCVAQTEEGGGGLYVVGPGVKRLIPSPGERDRPQWIRSSERASKDNKEQEDEEASARDRWKENATKHNNQQSRGKEIYVYKENKKYFLSRW